MPGSPPSTGLGSNVLKLSLVCFGIMEARQAINGDVQLARRFDSS